MIGSISNISMPNISQVTNQGGRMSLPVDSSALIYSHFRHVSGIPAPEGTQGVSISKLNLLDVLIGRLDQIKNSSALLTTAAGERLDAGHIDALIETYRSQIRQAQAASAAMPYIPSPNAQSGALFSLNI